MSPNPSETPKPATEEKTEVVWWHMFLAAALFYVGAVFVWWYITDLEEKGGGRIHWLIALLYNWGGKWLCVAVVGAIGVIFTAVGIGALVKKSATAAQEDEEETED